MSPQSAPYAVVASPCYTHFRTDNYFSNNESLRSVCVQLMVAPSLSRVKRPRFVNVASLVQIGSSVADSIAQCRFGAMALIRHPAVRPRTMLLYSFALRLLTTLVLPHQTMHLEGLLSAG